jgi:hypothetical protein
LEPVLAPALEYNAQMQRIILRRGMLHALHQRVLLALLANLPDAASITGVLEQLFPGEVPSCLLLDWVEELSSPALRGLSGLSVTKDHLAELRALPLEGREALVLGEIRAAWGESKGLAQLFG